MPSVSISPTSPMFEKFFQAFLNKNEVTLILPNFKRPVRVLDLVPGESEVGCPCLVKFKFEEVVVK